MDRALKGLMVEIGADTSGLAKALGEVTDKSKNKIGRASCRERV